MATGTVKRVVADRGFGFIATDDDKEFFFHRSGLEAGTEFESLNGAGRRAITGGYPWPDGILPRPQGHP